jgi:hypothetical protein
VNLYIFRNKISVKIIALGLVCLLIYNDVLFAWQPEPGMGRNATLSPLSPFINIIEDDGILKLIEDGYSPKTTKEFKEDAGFIYLSCLIGRLLEKYGSKRLKEKILIKLLRKHVSKTDIEFERFHWENLSKDGDTFCIPYESSKEGDLRNPFIRYYLEEDHPPQAEGKLALEMGNARIICEGWERENVLNVPPESHNEKEKRSVSAGATSEKKDDLKTVSKYAETVIIIVILAVIIWLFNTYPNLFSMAKVKFGELSVFLAKTRLHYVISSLIFGVGSHLIARNIDKDKDGLRIVYAIGLGILSALFISWYVPLIKGIPDVSIWLRFTRPLVDNFIAAPILLSFNFFLMGSREKLKDKDGRYVKIDRKWVQSTLRYMAHKTRLVFSKNGFFKVVFLFWLPIIQFSYYAQSPLGIGCIIGPIFNIAGAFYIVQSY